jgi:hypothetical protein
LERSDKKKLGGEGRGYFIWKVTNTVTACSPGVNKDVSALGKFQACLGVPYVSGERHKCQGTTLVVP